MIRSLYTAVSGMISLEAKQDTISSNLSNASTVGYKSTNLAFKKFEDVLMENYDKKLGNKNIQNIIGGLSMGNKIDEVNNLFTQGIIQDTGKPTDFALEGRGFFTIENNGRNYYTRDGHFHVDTRGYLVNDSGYNVMGINRNTGAREAIFVGNKTIGTDASGNIILNGVPSYSFQVADFNDYNSLKKIGDNLFEGNNPQNINGIVRQNSLEKSNVNVTNEMVNMLTTMRSFETNQKIVQSIDETLGKTVNEVGAAR
ncbi:TPA: flagellar basal-body rod protein FlgG [Clostridium botulinum]|uniref:flagellar basal-body rod protein FlgG n=1 Tax=Clostridium botulinum TaxID=1491 RepID=UPI00035BADA8|nr:flagellar basal-body rod protein FlgG [Clostridium botulinum]APH21227.1 flagellar hook-basal body family protein [Clostridium botulinum]APQ70611.1 flagellar hook-basal body family protein [Clostridium botulinum]EPS55625.1 flagellar basal body rod protein FlgG [Clostridium botulinum Af84]MBN3349376.1 flagellar biosynthesis protein FlgG [Clostridium botulinum]MBN3356944.1 flagellar biosynthesis protein FlgG [Clostridium botulinum]